MMDMQDDALGKPWIIRKRGGQMYACPDVKTLRQWIGEGRLRRDDQISKKGGRWFRLGDSPELAPYFDRTRPRPRHNSFPRVPKARARGRSLRRETDADKMINRFHLKRKLRGV